MSLLVVGSLAFDDIETPSGKRESILGGSATYFSLAASAFAPVRLVGAVGRTSPWRRRRGGRSGASTRRGSRW